jgi:hypothetical protein
MAAHDGGICRRCSVAPPPVTAPGIIVLVLGSIITAVVTPFDDGLQVDEDAFVDLLHHLARNGSDGFVVCGTTGEASTLSDAEHLRVMERRSSPAPAPTTPATPAS